MSGLPLIEPETTTGETADLLNAAQRALGLTPNLIKAMANSPAVLRGFLDLSRSLGHTSLPATAREGIALLVAQENGCDYCLSWHSYTGTRLLGLTQEQAHQARAGQADTPRGRAALTLAHTLLHRQGNVTDEELAHARHEGLSDEQLTEVVALVALNIFTTYFGKISRAAIDWPLVRHDDPHA